MVCSNKGCKIKANIGTRSGHCQSCEAFVRNANRRMEHQDWQHQARDSSYDAHRNIRDDDDQGLDRGAGPSHGGAPPPPPPRNIFNYPANNTEQVLPEVDISEIIKSCEEAKKGNQVDTGKVLSDICGMMVHMFSKQNENEGMKTQVVSNTDRIDQLEAKIGDPKDVSYSRSIAIRKLPLPPHGVSELQNAQHYLKEVKAEGVDISKDAIKAVRKEAARHNPNLGPNLGTVLVELRSEEIRGKLMKKKNDLETHSTQVVRELIIQNALTPAEMKAKNTNISLLKLITGGNEHYIAGNGMVYQKNHNNQQQQRYHQQQPRYPQAQAFRPPNPVQQTHQTRPESRPQNQTQPQQNTPNAGQFPQQLRQHFPRQQVPPQMPPFAPQFPQPQFTPYNFSFVAQPPPNSMPTGGHNGNPAPNLLDFDFVEAPFATDDPSSQASEDDARTDGRRTAHGQ
jgi:hypothetical protein